MLESRAACATVVSGCVDAAGDEQEHSATSSPWLCEMHTQVGKQAHALHAHILQCSNENLLIRSPQPAALQRERKAVCYGDEKQTELPKTSNNRRQRIAQLLESEREKERVASRGIRRVGTGHHATVDDGERSKNSQPIPRGVVQAQHSSKYMQRGQIHTVPYCAVYKTTVAVVACLRTK